MGNSGFLVSVCFEGLKTKSFSVPSFSRGFFIGILFAKYKKTKLILCNQLRVCGPVASAMVTNLWVSLETN